MDASSSFQEWEAAASEEIRRDPLWRMRVYRLAAYIADVAAGDACEVAGSPGFVSVADQLARAAGSVGANVAEGYSRGSGRDRVRLFEYALGSARETIHWYGVAGRVLGGDIDVAKRVEVLTEIRRMLLTIIPAERGRQITG